MIDVALDFSGIILIAFLPFMRILGMMLALPFFGSGMVPIKIRLIFCLSITLMVVLSKSSQLTIIPSTPFLMLILSAFYQLLIGITFGLIIHIIFQAFVLAGQITAMQMGLGFASLVDPQNDAGVPAVSQIYSIIAMLLYLSMNGHLYIISALIESFNQIPLLLTDVKIIPFKYIVELGSFMFSYGLKIALPAVIALLVTNIAFGVMSKSAPQINIFTLGFSISLIIGIFFIWLTLPFAVEQFTELCDIIHEQLENYVKQISSVV